MGTAKMSTFDVSKLSVLYVEDNLPSRRIMSILLRQLTIPHVAFFENSTDFIPRVEQLTPPPNLFLLDIHLVPLDGFEMLALLRKHPKFQDSLIIATTASVLNDEVKKLKEAGFNGVIAKPVDMDRFPETIERAVTSPSTWFSTND
jgi:CheY-like chemotaxis protein